MLTILQNKYAQIGGVIGGFMLMSERMSIIGWYILRVRMIYGSGRTTCSGMRVPAYGLYFFSVTDLDQSRPVPSEPVSAIAYVPQGDIPTR
jgi:hypothetical protein